MVLGPVVPTEDRTTDNYLSTGCTAGMGQPLMSVNLDSNDDDRLAVIESGSCSGETRQC